MILAEIPDPSTAHRVGVVVPPSNPVVEPELDALVGNDVLVYGSRLPRYPGLTLPERNRMYVPAYADSLDELFGLDPVCALVAMTGPNYHLGVDGDRDMCADLTKRFGAPVHTASLAIHDTLTNLEITDIHLLSPYPDWLTDETVRYWSGAGMNVVAVEHLLSQQLLQLGILILQRPQPLGLGHLQPAVLRLPFVERRTADPMPPADLGCCHARLLLLHDSDDLLV